MPLYEMLCITTHIPVYQHIRELVRQSALHVIDNGGVVRAINSWGTRTLPQRMKRHGPRQAVGESVCLFLPSFLSLDELF
jgi:small subunit ribosomal protein S6